MRTRNAADERKYPWSFIIASALQHAATDLVLLDRFEQSAEIALAETFVALALDQLEEDRADHGFGENLQQQPAARAAVDQDMVAAQPRHILAMAGQPALEHVVIGIGHVEEP